MDTKCRQIISTGAEFSKWNRSVTCNRDGAITIRGIVLCDWHAKQWYINNPPRNADW